MMLFAKGNMQKLLKKFYDALNPGGVVLLISEGIDLDNPSPQDMSLGYLPYYLQGMNIGVEQGEIVKAAETVGFIKNETDTVVINIGSGFDNLL